MLLFQQCLSAPKDLPGPVKTWEVRPASEVPARLVGSRSDSAKVCGGQIMAPHIWMHATTLVWLFWKCLQGRTYSSTPATKEPISEQTPATPSRMPQILLPRSFQPWPKHERIFLTREGFVDSGTIKFDHRDRLHPPIKKARLEPQRLSPNLDDNNGSQVGKLPT